MNDSSYIQTCVNTDQNRNYLWTMSTGGNFASYSSITPYAILDENKAKTGNYSAQCNKAAIYNNIPNSESRMNIQNRIAQRYSNGNKTTQRYSNGMCSTGNSCSLGDYSAFEEPQTTNSYSVGPYNNYGWNFVNTTPRLNVQYLKTPGSSYSNVCINGGMNCKTY